MKLMKVGLGLLGLLLLVTSAWGQEGAPETVILDEFASWRMFSVLKPPEIAFDDGVKIAQYKYKDNYWLNGESKLPPTGWTKPKFDVLR